MIASKQQTSLSKGCKSLGAIEENSLTSLEIDDQQQIKKYVQTNSQCCVLLKSGFTKQAIQLLEITERDLKERIKNDKKVNEILLIATLNNLSAAHQKTGNFNRSLDYVRSILHHKHNKVLTFEPPKDFESRLQYLNMEISIAKLYIYFLYLTLQSKMYEASTIPANKALQFFKKFCSSYRKSQLSLRLINTKLSQKLFSSIEEFESLQSNSSFWQLMEALKQSSKKISKLPFTFSKLKKFSIENLTKIQQMQIKLSEEGVSVRYSGNRGFQNGLIQFPLCLFLIGRSRYESLIVKNKNKDDQFQKLSVEQKAKQYILWSLHFAFQLCPYLTPLHKYIFQYYETNFNKSEKDQAGRKMKIIDSLQLPSLRDFDAWKDIKRQIQRVENEKDTKVKQVFTQQQNPIMSEKLFNTALQDQMKRQTPKLDKFAISKRKKAKQMNQQLFRTERLLLQSKKKEKKSTPHRVKSFSPHRRESISIKKPEGIKKIQPKEKVKKNQVKKNQSLRNRSLQRHSVNSLKKKTINNQEKKWNQLMQEYFPKGSGKKQKNAESPTNKTEKKKKLVTQYLNLQKKLRNASKSLSSKKKALFRSVKNI